LNKTAFVPAGQQDNLALSHSKEDAATGATDFRMGRAGANVLPVLQGHLAAIRLGANNLPAYETHRLKKNEINNKTYDIFIYYILRKKTCFMIL